MTIHAIVGGQYGSEAKGHVAAQLVKELGSVSRSTLHLVRVGGSNAGHSAVDTTGVVWALRQIPAPAVIDRDAWLYLAQGSEIDCDVLYDEITRLDAAGFDVSSRLIIDSSATVVEQRHIEAESGSDINARTGSTQKGIGAARADRLMRKAQTAGLETPPRLLLSSSAHL
jgi:adenylosuccinate synthase